MSEREKFLEQFGPKLIEAIVLVTMDEINVLRQKAGLPLRTTGQLLTVMGNKLDSLTDYNSMSEIE